MLSEDLRANSLRLGLNALFKFRVFFPGQGQFRRSFHVRQDFGRNTLHARIMEKRLPKVKARKLVRLLELPLVVALPALRRRPGLVPFKADGFEALHVAEGVQALGDEKEN
jgi:hypothetical protein